MNERPDRGFKQTYAEVQGRIEPTDMHYLVETYTPDKEHVVNLLCTPEARDGSGGAQSLRDAPRRRRVCEVVTKES